MGEGESRHDLCASCKTEGGFAQDGTAVWARRIQGDKTVREIIIVVGRVEGNSAGAGSSHLGTESGGGGR